MGGVALGFLETINQKANLTERNTPMALENGLKRGRLRWAASLFLELVPLFLVLKADHTDNFSLFFFLGGGVPTFKRDIQSHTSHSS